ncbi:HAMP domain-containing protein [Rhodococcus sp. KBS0724]|uniref:ATP-binding protein n=1 Tax=Rhodococcus sp. KBS0724 TaxID=1179674 RepID=UPI00110DDE9A|nr:ATP-binding protein [Rhodococcus sp. KBS0724]TSD47565.1 HAMP domain-containing protein [Rhodococcus sp. KBS0724]
MKHDAHTTSWWSIGEWRLGWKVVAVFAVPMLVAILLGTLRIQAELSTAAKLSSSADRVLASPAALRLEEALDDLAVASSSGAELATATAATTAAMEEFAAAGRMFQADATINGQVTRALQNSQSIIDEVSAGAVAPARLVTRVNEASVDIWTIFADIMRDSPQPVMRQSGGEFSALWSARRAFADQRILFGSGRLDQQERTALVGIAGAELAALRGVVLPRDESASSMNSVAAVNALRTSAQGRIDEIGATAATSPLSSQIDAGMQTSRDHYDDLAAAASSKFAAAVNTEANTARSAALRDTALVLGAVLAALVIALIISRSLVEPIRRLRFAALQAARRGLPEAIERIRAGEKVSDLEIPRVPVDTHEEIGQLARAVDDMNGQAIALAGEQAALRRQVNNMFETLSRRNKSLVDQQLGLIEQLEQDEDDPNRLGNLFRLDHIAARMRRNSDNLLILSGTEGRRVRTAPIALADALRASVSGVEDYQRVELGQILSAVVSGQASADVVHLMTELLDNALRYSPPETMVTIDAARTNDGSVLVEIADVGIGMSSADLLDANRRLSSGGEMSPDTARHMGLFVISRISRRYNISVRLRPSGSTSDHSGITAMVHLPVALLVAPRDNAVRTSTAAPVLPVRAATPVPTVQRAETSVAELAGVSANGLPQRQPRNVTAVTLPPPVSGAPSAVQSQALASVLPTSNTLPRRTPGNSGVPGTGSSLATEPETPAPVDTETAVTQSDNSESAARKPAPRHHFGTPNPTNTAAFFSSRTRDSTPPHVDVFSADAPEATSDIPAAASPIFSRMVSEWLVDPIDDGSSATSGFIWTTEADEGWVAARASTDTPVTRISDSGLPIRDRGARLVPGTIGTATAPLRSGSHRRSADPENTRRGWSDYQAGVSRGRRHADNENTTSLHSTTHVQKDEGEQ